MLRGERERDACQAVVEGGDWERGLGRLVPGWAARARAPQAFERRRAVRRAGELLRLGVGAGGQGGGQPLVASGAALVGSGPLAGAAVGKRVRQARAWRSAAVGRRRRLRQARWTGRTVRVRVIDATTIRAPGPSGSDWRGHARLDLAAGELRGLALPAAHGAERRRRQPSEPGALAVAARAHGRRTDRGQRLRRGTDLGVRIGWPTLPLEPPAGARLDRIAGLATAVRTPTERAGRVQTPTGTCPLRLLATPRPPAPAEAARRRVRRAAATQPPTVDHRTRLAAGWVLLVTTRDPTSWPRPERRALERCRGPIERLCKRLTRRWHRDRLRARDPDAAQVCLLGVILAARRAGQVSAAAPIPRDAWLDAPRQPLSRWRWEARWHAAILHALPGPVDRLTLHRRLPAVRRHLCDSPRRRHHQATTARHLRRSHPVHQDQRCA